MMKTKVFTLILLTAILSLAVVSAASLTITNINVPTSVNHDDGSYQVTFNLVNNGLASDIDWSASAINNGATISFSIDTIGDGSTTTVNEPVTATITYPFSKYLDFVGSISADPIGAGNPIVNTMAPVSIIASPSMTVDDATINPTDTQVTLTIENTGNVNFANVDVVVADITGVDFDDVTIPTLVAGETKDVVVTVTINENSLEVGSNDATVTVTAGTIVATGKVSVDKTYCEAGDIGDLEIDRLKFTNNGMGDKDEWYLTDEIEVEVRVENTHNTDKVKDIIVAWGLYNTETGDFIVDDEENDFNLDDDEKETLTFKFTLDPEDFEEDYSESDFVFYIKAYSDDDGEDVQCVSEIETDITVKKDDNFVLIDNIELTSDTLPCGRELSGSFKAWNVGEEDEEDTFVMIINEELGINEKIIVGDIDVLEDLRRTFSFMVPKDANEKSYFLRFTVYDEDGDVFENNEDDEAVFSKLFNVQGECKDSIAGTGDVLISAVNSPETPEAVAGEQFIIKSTLTNTGDSQKTYSVSVSGNSAWSNLVSIDPQLVVLNAGESKEVSIVLSIDGDASGDKDFTIKASSGDETNEQKVALTIDSGDAEFGAFSEHIRKNWFIYVIVLVNIILIIAIILVIRSMVRPREAYS